MVSGRSLKRDEVRIGGYGAESLCADGLWTQQIERVRSFGRWRVEEGRLCVEKRGEETCREALVDEQGGLWLAREGHPEDAQSYTIWPKTADLCTGIGAP